MNRTATVLAGICILLCTCAAGLQAGQTTADDARLAAAGWLASDPNPLGASAGRAVDRVETFATNAGEPVCHVAFLSPAGFVVVSADDRIEPIVAFSADDDYAPSPLNPLTRLIVRDLAARMNLAHEDDATAAAQEKWRFLIGRAGKPRTVLRALGLTADAIDDLRVPPLLDREGIQWGQIALLCGKACYNYFTPRVEKGQVVWQAGRSENYPAGCAATAMAQLMRFHKHPARPIVLLIFE